MEYWIQHTINWLMPIAVLSLLASIVPFIDLCILYGKAKKMGVNLPEGPEGGLPTAVILNDIIPGANGPRRGFLYLMSTFLICVALVVLLEWAKGLVAPH